MEEGLRKTLKSSPHVTPMISELPEEGRDAQSLIAEVGLICSLALTTTIEHVLTFYSLIHSIFFIVIFFIVFFIVIFFIVIFFVVIG